MAADPRLARAVDPRKTATPTQPPPPPPPTRPAQNFAGGYDGGDDGDGNGPAQTDGGDFKLKFCTVCASNQNRYVN